MVADRTIELEKARDALWGEMKLAKKIQTVLLPDHPCVSGYEVTVHMTPADEVGGDYYDIINIGGINWLAIGDVSGHGVPAGLVMMMLQTSVRTVLHKNPNTAPSKLLSDINKVLTDNIKTLGEDKYITISVFASFPDGRFVYSGLHEDIMIYRERTKKVELVKTRGMWLGIRDEIQSFMGDDELVLERGDILLLYTDGITEAFDGERNIYSKNRLKSLFEKSEGKSTEEIKSSIISDLEAYDRRDDITMVILKRLE
jgi:serine phosphatase RsbU (regulator of sigma subunit)